MRGMRRLAWCAWVALCTLTVATISAVGCSDDENENTSGAAAGPVSSSGAGGGISTGGNAPIEQVFPADPIIDGNAPTNAPSLFGDPGSGDPSGGPCLIEPEIGALFPNNWLRPRFRYQPQSGQNLFEIRLSAASQDNDLVVYTDAAQWTMSLDLWQAVADNVVDEPITVSIRGAVFDGNALQGPPALGSKGDITVAPVPAEGSIVYWTTTGGSSLKGFSVGEESVQLVLEPPQIQMPTTNGQVDCIGCHTSTPDGENASFTAQGPWSNALASIEQGTVGQTPAFITQAAIAALSQPVALGIHTYSKAHWNPSDRIMVTPRDVGPASQLAWFDLEASDSAQGIAWDVIARSGDPRGVGSPTWSHDGNTIVYVSTDAETDGRLGTGAADLYTVPYNGKAGGAASPIAGAAEGAYEEYYPAFSADDELVAFNRIPNNGTMYDNPSAELFVIPATGGTATRLVANDPAACSGATSPGVTNSWPKWAPEVGHSQGRTYHWMIFSSRRYTQNPQLYVTGVVVNQNGDVSTYASIYLWNQPSDENNHTPAWDVFKIPPPR